MVYHNEGVFKSVDGLELYYQNWYPKGTAKAILVIVHGLGGHSDKYSNIVNHLTAKEYAVYGLDLRGHGRSPGQRGHINAWADFRGDLSAFLKLIQTQQPQYPIFLLGHSLGAVVVCDYILRCPQEVAKLQGAIALAPAIGKVGVSKFRLLVGKLLSQIWPRFSLTTGLDLSAGSRDEKVVAAYAQDTLRHNLGSARLATEYFATVAWIHAHAPDWQIPLLILHGSSDRIASPEGGAIFYKYVGCSDKLRIEYPEAYHDLQADLNYQQVLADLENWLENHLP
ncbi:Alpha/beta hydrolase fold protein [Trichormus variabilis ATCC 29413]|uniref:Alpha/beta hydrolase fold protein n=2 Tax=Anabaena variabilis TaxID=264691 RepID=Q3M4N3_TRIV2|nr:MULTISPECIES: alpha/beta hydrolase [Nostocaceae]ABA24053.1 Alpha/beta hydrolase fold protein [Trichormus variabilis ATCC 29413]MBC1213199.1 lysophospholipase [Trichormus variabilis ARAD]MBC1253946.1 lysophospholipase [Trichormus variabilis V5]MBC1266657.1 lysophospholipase [Trichormus variabilis FSR]MBC1300730.1 lysophospholipase [Trichormus variabilis N2B]